MRILITGANGFIGKVLVQALVSKDREVVAVVRQFSEDLLGVHKQVTVGNITSETDWSDALQGVDVVIHLAARVHVMNDSAPDRLAAFRATNFAGTINVAQQAAALGVKRFVFLSSVKVNGEQTVGNASFTETDTPSPEGPYAISKHEAEVGLRYLALKSRMDVVIIRPPLVYGGDVKGNFLSMVNWLQKGIPLPLGNIKNQRSLIAVDNLVDFIITCTHHHAASNQVFLVSDGEDLSTTSLLRRMGCALGKRTCLLPVPEDVLQLLLSMLGQGPIADRLCGSLKIDITKAKTMLGWRPLISNQAALQKAVDKGSQ